MKTQLDAESGYSKLENDVCCHSYILIVNLKQIIQHILVILLTLNRLIPDILIKYFAYIKSKVKWVMPVTLFSCAFVSLNRFSLSWCFCCYFEHVNTSLFRKVNYDGKVYRKILKNLCNSVFSFPFRCHISL